MNLWLAFISLIGAWFLVLTIPGPNFVAVTQYSVSVSRRSGVFIALGVSTGAATWATAGLIGISALFDNTNWLYHLIKFAGGCYLMYMGLKIIVESFKSAKTAGVKIQKMKSGVAAFRVGLLTSYSNPKTAAFFGSLFLISFPVGAPAWCYVATVGMVFFASVIWYSLVAYFFSMLHVQMAYTRLRKIVDKLTGSIFVYLGARLAFSKA